MNDIEKHKRAHRGYIAEGAVLLLAALVVKGLVLAGTFSDGPLRHWYVQVALVAGAVGLYAGGHWLIGRGYRGARRPGS
ncbi:hypothetical protein COUCH_16990 [Couchioplanes caeruleus]|uniref:hypothetical protein n=1 Tax=Couchioplanes caeruleus TaxID=56438 RepID=UPI0020BE953D|nr:hypothetical protein [Couchioplanes caeruleus]UQU67865.1 hypothetical protein COUCH_16990 [Couchioplanes caeruleus]